MDRWLEDRFATILPPPPTDEYRELIRRFARVGRIGGGVYDGLVGVTARLARATLVTADVRAAEIYELVEVQVRMLDDPGGSVVP